MPRFKYLGLDPCRLTDGEFVIDLQPGDEFEAPASFVPEPNPHPSFKPVDAAPKKSAPATAPQE